MPSSSNFFTRLASEYLGGGCVKCCSSTKLLISTFSSLTLGSIVSSSFSLCLITLKNPSNFNVEPEHLN